MYSAILSSRPFVLPPMAVDEDEVTDGEDEEEEEEEEEDVGSEEE